jgi:uncharacterized membrane protein HdeD (DUF308 family)
MGGGMDIRRVRSILAICVVGVFMLITGIMAIYPLIGKTSVPLNEYADFFAKTASVYTGIIGVIIGYYFGRSDVNAPKEKGREKASGGTDIA